MATGLRGFQEFPRSRLGRAAWRGGVECVKFFLLLALVLSLTGCGLLISGKGRGKSYVVKGKRYYILSSAHGFRERGLASWYGEPFHGRRTASGEVYDMNRISAAHKTLPLQTWVEVRNLENNRIMTVRINDRGPFIAGRVIDLSRAAAKELGVYGPGLAKVHLKAITGRRARQLTATERARQGLALLARAEPGLATVGGEGGNRLARGRDPAPSAGEGGRP